MSRKPHITRGIPAGNGTDGPVPLRRELRDLEKNYPDQWNLYLLALADFQAVDENEQLSYYQIAGIHGRPYVTWDGGKGVQQTGYCTHTSILFPTWHRPYLSLFEEVLYTFVRNQADKFLEEDGEARYQKAAQEFRMPYWDWTLEPLNGEGYLPSSIREEKVKIVTPGTKGERVLKDNPLYQYHFRQLNPADGDKDQSVHKWKYTVRWPKPGTSLSQHDVLESSLENEVANLREKTFLLLASYEKYAPFSNQKWNPNTAAIYNSLEDVHNTIHRKTGGDGDVPSGNGHMGRIPYSAFDPIFWLHHTNIDRIFAIWQALHPDDTKHVDRYVTAQRNVKGTFITDLNGEETIKTPLAPFRADEADYWTSAQVKRTTTFGYAYPETRRWSFGSEKEYRAAIVKALKDLNPAVSLALILASDSESQKAALAKITKASTFWRDWTKKHGSPDYKDINVLAPEGRYLEWITNLKTQKHTVGGTFNVHVFIGDYTSNDSDSWPFAANHVGTFTVLGDSDDTGCEKCQTDQAANVQITGQVPLTIALLERYLAGVIPNLTEETVVPYLQANLHWRVTLGDGSERPRGDVDDLTVSVISNEVVVPTAADQLPIYAPSVELYPAVTTKKSGEGGRGDGTGLTQGGQV